MPTVESLLKAIRYYEAQGGSASIYVNEDGMQVVDPELAEYVILSRDALTANRSPRARKTYYELNNIGYCARPKDTYYKRKWYQRAKTHPYTENKHPEGYIRQGQFKKASNMNYCLDFSIRVEDELLRLIDVTCVATGKSNDEITVEEENVLYQKALETIIEQDEGRTWASGNVRIGDIILIIDSDTRVVSKLFLEMQ